jgi:opacity protein-like surface antigen
MRRIPLISTLSFVFIASSVVLCLTVATSRASAQASGNTIDPLISNTLGLGVEAGYDVCHEAHVGAPYLNVVSRIRIGSVVGLEAGIGYRGEQRFSFEGPAGADYSAKVHSIPVTGSLLLFVPLAPSFTPYLVGGIGAHYVMLDYSPDINEFLGDRSKARFGYHLGFGLEIPLNNHVALLGDYRYLFVDNAFEKELEFDFSSTKYRSNTFAAGVVVYF